MREVSVKLYRFDELPEEIQHKAWEQDESRRYLGESYNDDFQTVLAAFENAFDIRVTNYCVNSAHFTFDFELTNDIEAENLETIIDPLRLAVWVWNNRAHRIRKGKYYCTDAKWENGKFSCKFRHSRVIFEMDNCPLTGICWDNDILFHVLQCLHYRELYKTYDDLITDSLQSFFLTWSDCLEYAESIGYYAEEAAANEWEYTADGKRWRG